ncbi:MAG: hypothetical protein IH609_16550 [Dehalococcoidia bacterium]|nr:hypothetical protein [Dehalococcoidia bacterium]
MARTPMTLRNLSDYLNNLPNYGPLEAATARLGRPLVFTDADQLRERRGRLLLLEWKTPGQTVNAGQGILFDHLTRTGSHIVFVVWGHEGIPSSYILWGQMESPAATTLDDFAALLVAWDRWAQAQPLPPWAPPEWQPFATGKTV